MLNFGCVGEITNPLKLTIDPNKFQQGILVLRIQLFLGISLLPFQILEKHQSTRRTLEDHDTLDGRNPAPPGMYRTL